MAESKTPMTDACTNQFDEWDAEIARIKKEGREYAEKQLRELAERIKKWAKEKQKELEGDEKDLENSPVYQAFKKVKAAIEEISGSIEEMVNGIIEALKAIKDFMEQMITYVLDQINDLSMAATTIATRAPATIGQCNPAI